MFYNYIIIFQLALFEIPVLMSNLSLNYAYFKIF